MQLTTLRQISDYMYSIMLLKGHNTTTEIKVMNGVIELYNASRGLTNRSVTITCSAFLSVFYKGLKETNDLAWQESKMFVLDIHDFSIVMHQEFMAEDLDYYYLNEITYIENRLLSERNAMLMNIQQGPTVTMYEPCFYVKFINRKVVLYYAETGDQNETRKLKKLSSIWKGKVTLGVYDFLRKNCGDVKCVEYHPNIFQAAIRGHMISLALD